MGVGLWHRFGVFGDTVVAYVDLTPDAAREHEALAWLDKQELERLRRFLHPRPQRQFMLCRSALRSFLCCYLACRNQDLTFQSSRNGKPFALIKGTVAPVAFNVSHSGKHGLIAFARAGSVGIDVEERCIRRDMEGDIRTLFAPGEQAELRSSCGQEKIDLFYSLWTMKEALVKAVGAGLSLDTTGFEIPPAMYRGAKQSIFRFSEAPSVRWRLWSLDDRCFAAALAREVLPVSGTDADSVPSPDHHPGRMLRPYEPWSR